jgi:hypothetical protein
MRQTAGDFRQSATTEQEQRAAAYACEWLSKSGEKWRVSLLTRHHCLD